MQLHHHSFRILGLDVVLESDCAELVDLFRRDFRDPIPHAPEEGRGLHCRVTGDTDGGELEVAISGRRCSPGWGYSRLMRAHQVVLDAIRENCPGFSWFHAGVVVKAGGALIIAGPSGAGKSTLVLELVQRGYQYLSDEFCPIDVASRHVHPFALLPRVRPPDPTLWERGRPKPVVGMGAATTATGPCELRTLICLDVPAPGGDWHDYLEMVPRDPDSPLWLESLSRWTVVSMGRGAGRMAWVVKYPTDSGPRKEIDTFLAHHRDEMLHVSRVRFVVPEFSADPRATRMTTSEAAYFFLGEIKWGTAGDGRADALKTFVGTVELLAGVRAFRVMPGRLADTVRLVRELDMGAKRLAGCSG